MPATINYQLKRNFYELHQDSRWDVLTMLILHANIRNRCWPSMETLSKLIGASLSTVSEAKRWLLDRGAIEIVPYDKRIGEELTLPVRQHVYQLTGYFLNQSGEKVNYLYFGEESEITQVVITDAVITDGVSKVFHTEVDQSKVSVGRVARSNAVPMPSYFRNEFKIPIHDDESKQDNNEYTELEKLILEFLGIRKLTPPQRVELNATIKMRFNNEWLDISPNEAYNKLPKFEQWLKERVFNFLENTTTPDKLGFKKISRTRTVRTIRSEIQFYQKWFESNGEEDTQESPVVACQLCGGTGYVYDDDWNSSPCPECGKEND